MIPEPGSDDTPFLPPDWANLAPLLDEVLDAAPAERAACIARLSGGDPARQRALEQLYRESQRDLPLLDAPAAERFDRLADDDRPALPDVLGGRYRLGRELGRGGMAHVYLAHDTKHGRDVAIKVIRPDLAASMEHERFLREITIAARLRHPNIVPVYDSGEVGESLYFVMPYEDGQSLRDRLRQGGALPLGDALSLLRDIARALAYAHEHGVVHRDIKPDNVMLSGGAAVVTDFGIAKAVSAAQTGTVDTTITQAGTVIGTPAYMAPEQATGDATIDHRADIYSFGCLGYELLTGRPPFEASTTHLMIAAHLTKAPAPIATGRADAPAPVAALLEQCLAKDPAERPQAARELVAVLEGEAGVRVTAAGPVHGSRRRRLLLLGAVTVALALAVGYFGTRSSGPVEPLAVAVLPFGNMANDSTMDFVTDGLADEVATALARVPGIAIKSRSGARIYRGQLGVDVTEAGARLKADYLVTAVVRQDRGRWILSADLSRSVDAASLWGGDFRISAEQQAAAAGSIADSLASAFRRHFPRVIGIAATAPAAQRTDNNEAYRLYLRGQERLNRRAQSVRESAELFRQAIRQDSLYAPAHSGLSMALTLFPYFHGVPAPQVRAEAIAAAEAALALDPSLAQPHVALGLVHQFAYDWRRAATEFETAVRLDPRNVEARVQYARHLIFRGYHAEALEQLRAARDEDPASALVLSWLSYAYHLSGQRDSARVESERALQNDPDNFTTVSLGALVRLGSNQRSEARALISRIPLAGSGLGAYVLGQAGDTAAVRRQLETWPAEPVPADYPNPLHALAYLGLGDTARALADLEHNTDVGGIWPSLYGIADPLFGAVRRSERFRVLLRRVGLTDDVLAPGVR